MAESSEKLVNGPAVNGNGVPGQRFKLDSVASLCQLPGEAIYFDFLTGQSKEITVGVLMRYARRHMK